MDQVEPQVQMQQIKTGKHELQTDWLHIRFASSRVFLASQLFFTPLDNVFPQSFSLCGFLLQVQQGCFARVLPRVSRFSGGAFCSTHGFAISGAALVPLDRTLWKGIVVQGVVSQLVGEETCPQNVTKKVFKKCVRESLQEMRPRKC